MTPEEARREAAAYWFGQAQEALAAAADEEAAGRHGFALNRAYYACFYAASALLIEEGRTFKRHSGVRNAVHEHLVRPGRIAAALGESYDRLFALRMQADYGVFAHFEPGEVTRLTEEARAFVTALRRLAGD